MDGIHRQGENHRVVDPSGNKKFSLYPLWLCGENPILDRHEGLIEPNFRRFEMDIARKIGIGIVMIVPTFVGSGALWDVFHSWFAVIVWVILMAALVVIAVFIYPETLRDLFLNVLHREGSSHGLFVPFISGYFFCMYSRQRLFSSSGRSGHYINSDHVQ